MFRKLQYLPRLYKGLIMISSDVIILLFSLWISFVLGIESLWPIEFLQPNLWAFLLIPVIAIPLFLKLGLYRAVLQYVGSKVVVTSFQAITVICIFLGFLTMMLQTDLPRSVILIFWFVANTLVIVSRFFFQGLIYSWNFSLNNQIPIIIYGAGSAGIQLEEGLRRSSEYFPVAFIDDDSSKVGTIINHTRVHAFSELQAIVKKNKVKTVLLGISSLSELNRRELLKKLSTYAMEVKVIPSAADIVNGQVTIESIKHVDVSDILGRSAVEPKQSLLKRNILGKNILITGAGGSIGAELCRQIQLLSPNKIVLFDHSEFNLYTIHQELSQSKKRAEIIPILASVSDEGCIEKAIREHKIQTIYHAAAYKHVPMVEINSVEGVGNNILGTYRAALAAMKYKVENFILISTDKAVRPTNVMGATKRFSELILQALHKKNSNTCFSMVRFGNVLDSAGSVVPLFRKQIKEGGPLTITHKDVTRYFMSIPEAVQLVLQAGAMAKGGDVFVLDMGEPIKIIDLAYKMIHLSGMNPIDKDNPDGDIKIKFLGLRPGEKLYEELLIGNNVKQSSHPRIMQANEEELTWNDIELALKLFKKAHFEKDERLVIELLDKYVDGYTPESKEKLYKELLLN